MIEDVFRLNLPKSNSKIFAFTRWDAIPVVFGFLHLAYFFALFYLYPREPLGVILLLGFIYSVSISWNINGISHNFIHNQYFKAKWLNSVFSVVESVACCFSQTYYDVVHMQHHKGNSDYQDEQGETIDWLSIYRHGHEGAAENPWTYTFLGFFRDTPTSLDAELKKRGNGDHVLARTELLVLIAILLVETYFNWRFVIFFLLPFMYLGQCLSNLNGYYRHYGGNPDKAIAWGVSSYGKLYNWLWFFNGYHAEHHFRPKVHWTRMTVLHDLIKEDQVQAGVRVIKPPHALGFLDPNLPRREAQRLPQEV